MKIGGMRSYPKQILIGDHLWEIRFRKCLRDLIGEDGHFHGWTDEEHSIIWIRSGMTPFETFVTFLHEVVHCWESEGDFDIDHDSIHAMETWMARFLIDNCSEVANIVCSGKTKRRKTA